MGGGSSRWRDAPDASGRLAVSVMRGEGAGCFHEVADMSIVAANSRLPIGLNKDKNTHISVRQCKFCDICVMTPHYLSTLCI